MKRFFLDLLSPNTGISHKRFNSIAATATIIIIAITDVFAKIEVSSTLIDALVMVSLVGMGASTLERFAPFFSKKSTNISTEIKTT